MPVISVCICTYKRIELLALLLESLLKQTVDVNFEIIVVDNDVKESARPMVTQFAIENTGVDIRYENEKRSGVSFVRNKLISLSRGEYVAFIDDDELAVPNWLAELYRVQRETGATAVFGPVVSQYPEGSKQWMKNSGYFDRNRFETGTVISVDETRTGNVLFLKAEALKRGTDIFSIEYAASGGEDSEFFNWFANAGAVFVWSDEAIVYELVPLARQSLGFMLKRDFRTAANYWKIKSTHCGLQNSLWKKILIFITSIGLITFGFLFFILTKKYSLRIILKGVRGLGRFYGDSNIKFSEYGRENS